MGKRKPAAADAAASEPPPTKPRITIKILPPAPPPAPGPPAAAPSMPVASPARKASTFPPKKAALVEPDAVEQPESESGEEDAWLDALEAGELDEHGDLPAAGKAVLTARQRAKQDPASGFSEELMALPMVSSRKSAPVTEEDEAKLAEKVTKRKQREQQRADELMENTIQGLLKKQAPRKGEDEERQEKTKKERRIGPHVRYVSTAAGASLSLPEGMPYPLAASKAGPHPGPRPQCAGPSCPNPRRYACAESRLPLCSLECYRKLRETPAFVAAVAHH
eukprot:m.42346 g.42346  ORF g.42346 m.42346 type:complete len:279 (-) comp5718_c0_seq2:646-1482(-)